MLNRLNMFVRHEPQSVVDHFPFPTQAARLDKTENADQPPYPASPIMTTIIRKGTLCCFGCVEQQHAATLPRSISDTIPVVVKVAHPRELYTTTGTATSLEFTKMTATGKLAWIRETVIVKR